LIKKKNSLKVGAIKTQNTSNSKKRKVNLMKNKYDEIVKHIPNLKDHGHLYMYYGTPYSDECDIYEDYNEDGYLILSHECHSLCRAIADKFEYDYEWFDILDDHEIVFEKIFDIDIEKQDIDVVIALLLYLVGSITYEDKFIDALNNNYLIRLIERLKQFE